MPDTLSRSIDSIGRDADIWFPGHILLVNKTFSVEAAPLVYCAPTFVFDSLCDAVTFLRKIGTVNCSHITELSFGRFWLTPNEAAYLDIEYDEVWERVTDEVTKCLSNLTSLTLYGADREGPKQRWNVKALENYQSLMNKLPGLPFVYWRPARLWLSSTADTGQKLVSHNQWLLEAVWTDRSRQICRSSTWTT